MPKSHDRFRVSKAIVLALVIALNWLPSCESAKLHDCFQVSKVQGKCCVLTLRSAPRSFHWMGCANTHSVSAPMTGSFLAAASSELNHAYTYIR